MIQAIEQLRRVIHRNNGNNQNTQSVLSPLEELIAQNTPRAILLYQEISKQNGNHLAKSYCAVIVSRDKIEAMLALDEAGVNWGRIGAFDDYTSTSGYGRFCLVNGNINSINNNNGTSHRLVTFPHEDLCSVNGAGIAFPNYQKLQELVELYGYLFVRS